MARDVYNIHTNAGVDGGELSDHQGQASRAPTTRIGELPKCYFCRSPRRKHPKDDNDGQEAENMHNQHDVLEDRHRLGSPDIHDPNKDSDGNDHERALPISRRVVGIHDDSGGLDQCTDEEGSRCSASLPR